jgi:hypothetical protein
MKNFISRIALCGMLAAGATFAAQIGDLRITLPHAVTVGSTTLPQGSYTITPMEMGGAEYFVVRGENMTPVVMPAMKEDGATADKTTITLSREGDTWRFGKLFIEGESAVYEFGR